MIRVVEKKMRDAGERMADIVEVLAKKWNKRTPLSVLDKFLVTAVAASSGTARDMLWLRRMIGSLAVMTALGLLGVIAPYCGDGVGAVVVSLLVALALVGTSGALWWQLQHVQQGAAEETLLREAFNCVLTPQLITDDDGNEVLSNRAFKGWINLGEQSLQQGLTGCFGATSEAAAEFKRVQDSLYVKNQSVITDLPVTRGNRVIEWRRIVARPLDGAKKFYHWRFEDISERRRMEKAMRDEKNKLVDFMAHAPVGIYAVDQHGRFRFVNQTLATWLQVTPDELVKGDVRVHDVLGESPKDVAPYAIAPGAQGEIRGEVMMRRRDGQLFPVAITQTVVAGEEGKALRTRSIVRDLSPEREWQQALTQSEYRFHHLFAEAPIGVVLLDSQYVIQECNQAFLGISRRTRREAVVNAAVAELIVPTERHGVLAQLTQVLGGADFTKPIEVRLAADREVITQMFVKRFAAGKNGATTSGLMLYFIDVTEPKRLEVQFAQSQKMQAIGQLAGGVAHDFNNLLTAMIGFCDLLLQRHKPGDQSFSDIMQIKQNGNRAANLVRQLLAFSRQQTMQPKVLNLVDVVSELSNLLRRLIGATITLDVIYSRDVGLVKVDQGQLEQVIINLVVNARDAMPNGGTVTIRAQNLRQTEYLLRGQDEMPPGDYVVIEVEDTGTGIPKEIMSRIFEPFFSTKEIGSGTGLGLSTVYGIVRQTGGFVGVNSKMGKGSIFSIYLPALGDKEKVQETRSLDDGREDKPGPDLTGAGTILLVEDEDAVRVFSTRALNNKGYKVLEARSGEEALAILDKEGDKIDLTITDVVMPQMDGPTLYKHLRDRWPHMKVLFVSGYTEDRLREQFKSGEVIHFVGKPFTLKQLAGKVKELLELSA